MKAVKFSTTGMRRRIINVVLSFILPVCLLSPALLSSKPADEDSKEISYLPLLEKSIFELTNKNRKKAGLDALKEENTLRYIAREHSRDMIKRKFFSHYNPDGLPPGERIAIRHRRLIGASAENIWNGQGYDPSKTKMLAKMIMDNWMQSPSHRKNILKEEYTHLGVGVAVRGKLLMATQNFAGVAAYTDQPVPGWAEREEKIDLSATPVSETTAPVKVDFYSPKQEKQIGQAQKLPLVVADIEPGVYHLRFYFPAKKGEYTLYIGPEIKIK